jgi:hypothetical protein
MRHHHVSRLVAACAALAIGALAAPAVAAADFEAFVSQSGAPETQLARVSSCTESPTPDGQGSMTVCGDGPAQPGPRVTLEAGTANLRFERAISELSVQIARASQPEQPTPVTRVDDTHWTVQLPSSVFSSDQLRVSARGGSDATRDRWDAFYVATLDVPVRTSLTTVRAKGRTVTATLGLSGAARAPFVAYVRLDGRRVSTQVTGAVASTRRLALTLRRATWRAARRRAALIVRVSTPAGRQILRVTLPR